MGIIRNVIFDYQNLSHATARAREAGIKGIKCFYGHLRIDCFADNSRRSTRYQSELNTWEPEENISIHIEDLKRLPSIYHKEILPRWVEQPNYVEVWTEKAAMVGTFAQLLSGRQIAIVPFGGFHSVTYLWESARILRRFQQQGKKIHILYFGDFDPTGMVIEKTMKNKLSYYGLQGFDWKRIGVTYEQMIDFKLPQRLDPKTYKKLEDHHGVDEFRKKYKGLYQIEIDALPALRPEKFRNMVIDSVDQLFDEEIYQQILKRYSSEQIREQIAKSVKYEFNLRSWW